jgi:hypothetical protein
MKACPEPLFQVAFKIQGILLMKKRAVPDKLPWATSGSRRSRAAVVPLQATLHFLRREANVTLGGDTFALENVDVVQCLPPPLGESGPDRLAE